VILALALSSLAHATDPLLEGLPGAQSVTVARQAQQWTVTAKGRSVLIAPVQTEADQVALRALVTSLLAEVDLRQRPTSVPDPSASRALAMLAPPPVEAPKVPVRALEPRPEPGIAPGVPEPVAPVLPVVPVLPEPVAPEPIIVIAPILPVPELPQAPAVPAQPLLPQAAVTYLTATATWRESPRHRPVWWFGPELVVRPDLAPVVGPAMGWTLGERVGLEPRVALRWSRATVYGTKTRLGELASGTTLFWAFGPLRLQQGLGLGIRRYTTDGTPVGTHLMVQDLTGVGLHFATRRWDLDLNSVLEYDLMPTHLGWSGPDDTLVPAALRLEIRLAPSFEPRPRSSTSEGGPQQRGDL
jgi:hypothetical protein